MQKEMSINDNTQVLVRFLNTLNRSYLAYKGIHQREGQIFLSAYLVTIGTLRLLCY